MNNSTDNQGKSNREFVIQVYMQEYDKLREELIHYINVKNQIPVWVFGVASIAIPLLLTQTSNISPSIIASLLYATTIIFAGMTLIYVSTNFNVHQIAAYIRDFIEPQINQLVSTSDFRGFQWETFVKQRRASFLNLFLEIVGEIGTILLLLLPGLASLMIAEYIKLLPQNSVSTQIVFQGGSNWLHFLTMIAWFLYLLSIISLITITIYAIKLGVVKPVSNKSKKKR